LICGPFSCCAPRLFRPYQEGGFNNARRDAASSRWAALVKLLIETRYQGAASFDVDAARG
jgi:hypothetical protein